MSVAAVVRLLRPGDWVKNVFVLPALIFSLPRLLRVDGAGDVWSMLGATAGAFVAFSFLASGFYALNDVVDAPRDRLHPVKRRRPVASGAVTAKVAVGTGAVMMLLGLAIGFAVGAGVGAVLLVYAVLQALYNAGLKRVPIVDACVVSLGFALRAAAGALAIGVQVSIWLLLCVFFLCLFLAFIKRLCDIASAASSGDGAWRSPAGYDDRLELNWLLAFSGVPAVMTYLMYALSDHAWALFGPRTVGLAMLSPLVLIVMHRFYRRASRGLSDSPAAAILEDHVVLVASILYGAGVLVALFAPGIDTALDAFIVPAREPAP